MNDYLGKEKINRNIDMINIGIFILTVIPILLFYNFIENSFEKSDLLIDQFEYFDELKTLCSESNVYDVELNSTGIENMGKSQMNSLELLQFKQKIAKLSHRNNSIKSDFIELILITFIALLLIKVLKNKKDKLNKKATHNST